ncbi:MAG: ribosome maturation factor RimM [Acidimicrobiales bacterium]|nr:ribosome maturation factor RimM [Acidimicrobiales bacterium]
MVDLLEIGRVAKAHGLRGEVIVALTTDRTERLDPGVVLDTDRGPLTVERSSPHQQRWIVAFEGVSSREAAEALHGVVLRAEPIEDDDVWFVHELIDRDVLTIAGELVGRSTAVVDNPAHDLLEVDGSILVPLPFVVEVDDDRIVIDPPDGLLDLV